MLERKISMRTIFVNLESIYYVKAKEDNSADVVKSVKAQDIEDADLPTEGTLYALEDSTEVKQYIAEIKKMRRKD